MLSLPGLVSETHLEFGQPQRQMVAFPAQLHPLHVLSAPAHPPGTQTAGLTHCPRGPPGTVQGSWNQVSFSKRDTASKAPEKRKSTGTRVPIT